MRWMRGSPFNPHNRLSLPHSVGAPFGRPLRIKVTLPSKRGVEDVAPYDIKWRVPHSVGAPFGRPFQIKVTFPRIGRKISFHTGFWGLK